MCMYLGQQLSLWLTIWASDGQLVGNCAWFNECVCACSAILMMHAFKGSPEWVCFTILPSAIRMYTRLFLYCDVMWVNTLELVYKCVCVKLQLCVRVFKSPVECEVIPLVFSLSGSLFPPHCFESHQNRGPAGTQRSSIIHYPIQ